MKFYALVLVGALLAGLLVGCGGGENSGRLVDSIGRSVPPRDSIPGLSVTVAADKTTYATGEPIQITISVTNTSGQTRAVSYPHPGPNWGYILAQNGSIVAYEYWEGHQLSFPAVIATDTYAPGETKQIAQAFPQTYGHQGPIAALTPGSYQLYAKLPSLVYDDQRPLRYETPTPASDPLTITITP